MAAAPSFRLVFADSKLTGRGVLSTCVRPTSNAVSTKALEVGKSDLRTLLHVEARDDAFAVQRSRKEDLRYVQVGGSFTSPRCRSAGRGGQFTFVRARTSDWRRGCANWNSY